MAKKKKKQSKIKSCIMKFKRFLNWNKSSIVLFVGLLIFPIIIGLLYKIPISFIDIEIGDLLSFYAVALGLFATYLTYRKSEDQRILKKQNSLRPRLEIVITLNDEEDNTKVCINNTTDNDYIIDYIDIGYYGGDENQYLNSKNTLEFIINACDNAFSQSIYVGVRDDDGNEWAVGFEYQEGTNKYCRTYIDLVA